MDEELPKEFDLIVIGTGFPETVVAAAASRIGKTVLHIDPNEYYGGSWSSFSLEAFIMLMDGRAIRNRELTHFQYQWHIPLEAEEEMQEQCEANNQKWSVSRLMQLSRKFNIDLCPKILYSSGKLVQLLISSNICRYAEFRAIDRVCTVYQNELLNVPCSRSDVFNTKDLNIVEKRLLMKFLTTCMAYGENKCEEDSVEFRGRPFSEYLKKQQITEKINRCIMQAIAMVNEDTSFEEGMEKTKKFLQSLGRYGNTPFIFPMYGCGEIPQCFCRFCAVFGGIYCLKKEITDIHVEENGNKVIVEVENLQTIQADYVVCSPGNLTEQLKAMKEVKNHLSRGIFLSIQPLGGGESAKNGGGTDGGVNLLRLLTSDGQREAICIQLSCPSGTCPKGIYIYHLISPSISNDPATDLQPFKEVIFPDLSLLLMSAYFTITSYNYEPFDTNGRILVTDPPFYELDYDLSIENAYEIFKKLYNDAEFLPRAPDPEEIVIEGEDPRALIENQLPEDLRAQLHELEMATHNMDIEENMNIRAVTPKAMEAE
uniref:Rab proteins geranylgeranyltransferase component A n=1 Tax=Glossina palpalis gambiensis TaxID=67801 RepID=A0A1B0ARC9_9MUSC